MRARMLALQLAAIVLVLAPLCVAYDNGAGGLPPMGWNTWCDSETGKNGPCAKDVCNEAEIMAAADAMVAEGLPDFGYEYINLDDCWAAPERTASGELAPMASEFPNGMAAVADYVHARGLKLGLYTCVGETTCRHGKPGSFGHYETDAATLASWGVDYVKCDNCNLPEGYTELEMYTNFSRALNGTGRPILFALCDWGLASAASPAPVPVVEWGGTVGQSFRIQRDHWPLWWTPPTPLAPGAGTGSGIINVIEYMAQLRPSQWVRRYGWGDADFLFTGYPTESAADSRTEFTFWTLWSAPLIFASGIVNMTAEAREILTNAEAIAINQDPLATGGDRLANNTDGTQVWGKPLANGDWAVVLLNGHDLLPRRATVDWTLLGLDSTVFAVRDLWAHADLGNFTRAYSVVLPAHDVAYLRVTPL